VQCNGVEHDTGHAEVGTAHVEFDKLKVNYEEHGTGLAY